jgi:hypothetical protein
MVRGTIIADLRKYGFDLVSVPELDLVANDSSWYAKMMGPLPDTRNPKSC